MECCVDWVIFLTQYGHIEMQTSNIDKLSSMRKHAIVTVHLNSISKVVIINIITIACFLIVEKLWRFEIFYFNMTILGEEYDPESHRTSLQRRALDLKTSPAIFLMDILIRKIAETVIRSTALR